MNKVKGQYFWCTCLQVRNISFIHWISFLCLLSDEGCPPPVVRRWWPVLSGQVSGAGWSEWGDQGRSSADQRHASASGGVEPGQRSVRHCWLVITSLSPVILSSSSTSTNNIEDVTSVSVVAEIVIFLCKIMMKSYIWINSENTTCAKEIWNLPFSFQTSEVYYFKFLFLF